jgi:hypothetical protein
VLEDEQALVRSGRYGFRGEWDSCTERQAKAPLRHALRALASRGLMP